MLRSSKIQFFVNLGRRSIVTPATPEHYRHGAISEASTHTANKLKQPARGGQNLSHRYVRLENSLRGKEALSKQLDTFAENNFSVPSSMQSPSKSSGKLVEMFRGFVVPEEPKPPADDECCMSGCAVCVYDLHEDSLDAYNEALTELRASLSALAIPEVEWPLRVRSKGPTSNDAPARRNDVVLSAFEEMERRLAMKNKESAALTSTSTVPRWKQRQQLAAAKKEEARDIIAELFEGIKWVLLSGR